jgi:mannose-6-phosphate isomerase-like protein (cupin superfamily)
MNRMIVMGWVVLLAVTVGAQNAGQGQGRGAGQGSGAGQAAQNAPPAPAPGSAGVYKSNADLQAVLKKAMAGSNDMVDSPIANNDQYRVNIVHRPKAAGAIAHPGNTELHYIIDGSGTIVTGGKIVRAEGAPAGSATIEGGEAHKVVKGDVVIIPAGSAHWYKEVNGEITYLEVRFVAPR